MYCQQTQAKKLRLAFAAVKKNNNWKMLHIIIINMIVKITIGTYCNITTAVTVAVMKNTFAFITILVCSGVTTEDLRWLSSSQI